MSDFPVTRRPSLAGATYPGRGADGEPADGGRGPSGFPEQPPGAPFDLRVALRVLVWRWWVIVPVMLVTVAAAWYWERGRPTLYRADAVVRLVSGGSQLAASTDDRRDDGGTSMLSQVAILRSRAVAAAVVDSVPVGLRVTTRGFPAELLSVVRAASAELDTAVDLTFSRDGFVRRGDSRLMRYGEPVAVGDLQLTLARPPDRVTNGTIVVVPTERAIDAALAQLEAIPRKPTALLDIKFTAGDPVTALRVVNAFVNVYQATDLQLARQQLRRRWQFIEQQIRETDGDLLAAEHALSAFRTRQQAYSPQEKFDAQRTSLDQITGQWTQLDAERRLTAALLAQLTSGDSASRAQAFRTVGAFGPTSMPVVSRLYTRLAGYEVSLAEMTSGPHAFTPRHDRVLAIVELIDGVHAEIIHAVQAQVDVLDARLASLNALRTGEERRLRTTLGTEGEQTRLSQNAAALQQQAVALRSQFQQARVLDAAVIGDVQIVDLATRSRRLTDRSQRVILYAVLLGLLLGSGVALALEVTDRSVKNRATLEAVLQLPVLATIPCIGPGAVGLQRLRLPSVARNRRTHVEQRRTVALATASDLRAPSSEAFRQLRTNLQYARMPNPLRAIVVTSALPGDGKTSIAVNLAISFAQQRLRVLIIDCDLIAPSLHRVLDLPIAPGLDQIIFEHALPMDVVQAGPVRGLFVITAGAQSGNQAEALGSPRMLAMLPDLKHDFDVIVLDCPPVLAASDALILGGATDGVLFVVRAGSTLLTHATEALLRLDAAGASVVGAVLNDPDGRMERYGGSYYFPYVDRREAAPA